MSIGESIYDIYASHCRAREKGLKEKAREAADRVIAAFRESPDREFVVQLCESAEGRIDHIIWSGVVLPFVSGGLERDPVAIKCLIQTIQNVYADKRIHQRLGWITDEELTARLLKIDPEHEWARRARIRQLSRWLSFTVHEWPAGVLYGMNGATLPECDDILRAVEELRNMDGEGVYTRLCDDVMGKVLAFRGRLAGEGGRRS